MPPSPQQAEALPSYKQPLPLFTQLLRFIPTFFVCTFILAAGLVVTNARMPDPKVVRPLPDFAFDILPKVPWLEHMTDVVIFLLNASTVVVAVKVYLLGRRVKGLADLTFLERVPYIGHALNRLVLGVWDSGLRPFSPVDAYLCMMIRFLCVYGTTILYRTVCIVVTSYPATDNHCQNPVPIERPLLNMVLTVVTFGNGAIHCGDLMFSGHTIIICLAACLTMEYGRLLHRFIFLVYPPILVLLSFFFILASRSHYTNDIVVAAHATITSYLLIPHRPTGAPWQLQLVIAWWPCLGSSEPMRPPAVVEDVNVVEVTVEPSYK